MTKLKIDLDQRISHLSSRAAAVVSRCQEMQAEVKHLLRDDRRTEDVNRGLFVADLVDEALNKAIEAQLSAKTITNLGDRAPSQLAISERWVTAAFNLLNEARLVLDDVKDIFGLNLPTGGLWDK